MSFLLKFPKFVNTIWTKFKTNVIYEVCVCTIDKCHKLREAEIKRTSLHSVHLRAQTETINMDAGEKKLATFDVTGG